MIVFVVMCECELILDWIGLNHSLAQETNVWRGIRYLPPKFKLVDDALLLETRCDYHTLAS